MIDGGIKFIMVFGLALLVSSLLLTIEWFTWGAWVFVALMLTWKYYLNNSFAENAAMLWKVLYKKIDTVNSKLEYTSTQLSTKTTRHKSQRYKNKNKSSNNS